MGRTFEGHLQDRGWRYGIVVSRFNSFVTTRLVDGALDALSRHGVEEERIDIAWTPGAFEVPFVAAKLARTGDYDAIVCLGAVIRGDTPHFDYVANESARKIADLSVETSIPVIYGIITADNLEQAIERAGTRMGNKGAEAAMAALEMVSLAHAIDGDEE